MTKDEEREEATWKRRYLKLVAEGCPDDEAHELAAQMTLIRDKDIGDDRKICLEVVSMIDRRRARFCSFHCEEKIIVAAGCQFPACATEKRNSSRDIWKL